MFSKLLIANRGEIALRIARAGADLGIETVTVFAEDDRGSWAGAFGGESAALGASGPAAYLDGGRLIEIAKRTGCAAVHPGYGFLSERADFARACAEAGLVFVGATPDQLALFGDKGAARAFAARLGAPIAPGSARAVSLDEARAFFAAGGERPILIKAVSGGGGRGLRVVRQSEDLEEAYRRCVSEASNAFGAGEVLVERFVEGARHIEAQIAGDGDNVVSLGERDCTLQRRFQKIVEIAPSPRLSPQMRLRLEETALTLAKGCAYVGLGTFEFLVDEASPDLPLVFLEVNPRLQVEHTVTEEVTGLDLVRLQLEIAAGAKLPELGLAVSPSPRGYAIQWRLNAEDVSGALRRFDPPGGPGVRVDTHLGAGAPLSPRFDPLLAKLIVHDADPAFAAVLRRSKRALAEWRVEGAATNLPLLRALAERPEFASQLFDAGFVEAHLAELATPARPRSEEAAQDGLRPILAPMAGRIVEYGVAEGAEVAAGAPVAVLEAMKMEHLVLAPAAGRIHLGAASAGEFVAEGETLALLAQNEGDSEAAGAAQSAQDLDAVRPDLQLLLDRRAATVDEARPQAMEKRHALGLRSARENIADLCDPGSFVEYGAFAVAAQRSRRKLEDLIANTPADGIVTGVGGVNSALFGEEKSRTAVMAYDATVLAGTQGLRGHEKSDRLIEVAERNRLPMVLFAEGGGGRPGDVDADMVAGLHLTTFAKFAALSGQAPVIGIAAGRCFAGNAALLGCCDLIVATRDSNIGMGGPAMIEGGGLGRFRPEDIGPSDVQAANGVIDALVENEAEAVAVAKTYLGLFQGRLANFDAADARRLRAVVPENRLRAYDMREAMRLMLDAGTMLELRPGFGRGVLTAFGRVEGRAIGILANNPAHLGGAIDADAADKGARFLQLCNAHGLPLLSLIDTPGFMVGPETEAKAQVRHVSRLFVAAASLRVPVFALVLRKGYGLGAMAMAAGGFHQPDAIAAWPSGEFGGMGLEGAVRLGFRRELEAAPSPEAREALYRQLVARQYEAGGAVNMAMALEIDAVIDPAESRAWLARGLAGAKPRPWRAPAVDTW